MSIEELSGRRDYRGPVSERPSASLVPPGFLWEDPSTRSRRRSDGTRWLDASAELDAWVLEYAEDLQPGTYVRQDRDLSPLAQSAFAGLLGGSGRITEWVILDEVRTFGDMMSCRAVRPDGVQVALYCARGELVRVRTESPLGAQP